MEKINYKDTLNMSHTSFSMKGNLVEKDAIFNKFWSEKMIYKKSLKLNEKNKSFVLHDGPPYANGSLHIGHALNKILKDIVVRRKNMEGFFSPFVFGWDTHGLPIENKMLNEMSTNHKDITVNELRKKAKEYALSQVEMQKNEFKELSLFSDFDKFYVTLEKKYEKKQLELFKKMALDGLVYRGLKPVYWSPSSQSALAEAEVEHKEHRSPSLYVSFEIKKGNAFLSEGDNLIIWTTTPWTLVANSGIAASEKLTYLIVEFNDKRYVFAKNLFNSLVETFEWENPKIISEIKGSDLIGIEYLSIVNGNIAPVVSGHHVTDEAGTGLVHIAPLFGEDDYQIGKKYNLEMIMHVNDDGTLNDKAGHFENIFYQDANKEIGNFIHEKGQLLKLKFIKHSYPHDWRTGLPIIFRGTPQWFISIDKIKGEVLDALKTVEFSTDWGFKRISNMIESRTDWTISRQRSWGVPIIIFYDEQKNVVINEKIFDYVIDLVGKHGTDIWFDSKVDDLLPEEFRNKNWTKENDIMDVWFDSGSSFLAVDIDDSLKAPYDLYLEGSDQYRGWFNSSLINSVAWMGKSPYKALLSHGFVLDEKGEKMSKSKGNVIAPSKIIKTSGSDILRLWAANSEYKNDINIGLNIIKQNEEIYRKIRNTIRFMLSNLSDYKYEKQELSGVHLLIDEKLKKYQNNCIDYYESYNFIGLTKETNNFLTDLSSFYLSITKDTLYVEAHDSIERKMVQFNIYNILETIIFNLAPIMPVTMEEAYAEFNKKDKKESIFLERKIIEKQNIQTREEDKWKEFFDFKDMVYVEIEKSIKNLTIKRSSEAIVYANIKSKFLESLELEKLLLVGKVVFTNESQIIVDKFDSIKCERCWNHFEKENMVGQICNRCAKVMENIKNAR